MSQDGPQTFAERMRFARKDVAQIPRPTDAAILVGVRPGTYRTYEVEKADGGRVPNVKDAQRIAKRFGVSWVWLLHGEGQWDDERVSDPRVVQIDRLTRELEPPQRDLALDAALGVIEAFSARKIRVAS